MKQAYVIPAKAQKKTPIVGCTVMCNVAVLKGQEENKKKGFLFGLVLLLNV